MMASRVCLVCINRCLFDDYFVVWCVSLWAVLFV